MAESEAKRPKLAADDLDNRAFVFVKPHAQVEKMRTWVRQELEGKGLRVEAEGEISGATIDEKGFIIQHYYPMASKAMLISPKDMPVSKDKFKAKYGLEWDEVVASGKAFNAAEASKKFGLSATELEKKWRSCEKENSIKLGGGFYVNQMEFEAGSPVYVFNGFFPAMQIKYTASGCSIWYFVVSWKPSSLSWGDFRGKVIGATKASEAAEGSIRHSAWKSKLQELGLSQDDNTVHASASPFEGLSERCNWLGTSLKEDPFGAKLLAEGFTEDFINSWFKDPQVIIDDKGTKKSIFDSIEDLDAVECLEKLIALKALN